MEKNKALSVFGENIRHAREKAGLSQENLAFECGVYRTYIGEYFPVWEFSYKKASQNILKTNCKSAYFYHAKNL